MPLSRRKFILGSILVSLGGAGLGRYVFLEHERESAALVRALCDHFVPGHGTAPSAAALGIDVEIVDLLRTTRRSWIGLFGLRRTLDARGFDALNNDAQRASLAADLETVADARAASRPPPREAALVDTIYRECTRRYLTRPEGWAALGYRTPQPHGYPDYTSCSAS